MDLREMALGDVDRIKLAKNIDQWRALVKTVINFGVP
jgi:hypothetical protein